MPKISKLLLFFTSSYHYGGDFPGICSGNLGVGGNLGGASHLNTYSFYADSNNVLESMFKFDYFWFRKGSEESV